MTVSPELTWSLQIGSGIFWTAVYIVIIRLGFRERTYGMPITPFVPISLGSLYFPSFILTTLLKITLRSFGLSLIWSLSCKRCSSEELCLSRRGYSILHSFWVCS